MAWAWNPDEACFLPNGEPFAAPSDSFERVYNQRLEKGYPLALVPYYDVRQGWPLSMRSYMHAPGPELLRPTMDLFFDPEYQRLCKAAGNTDDELLTLSTRLLTHAAMAGIKVTEGEQALSKALGVSLENNPLI